MVACLLLAAFSWFRFCRVLQSSFLVDELVKGESTGGRVPNPCVGTQCYEVWSCYGMQKSTEHLLNPLFAMTGIVFWTLGFIGAYYALRWQVRYMANYAFTVGLVLLGCMIFDLVYAGTCDAYTANTIHTLTKSFPPSPITSAARDTLKDLETYPRGEVDDITNGFRVLLWYSCGFGLLTALVIYLSAEAYGLARLIGRGPLGLGVHYGLDQWDEYVDMDAVRRKKSMEMKSKFIEDAKLPFYTPPGELRAPYGFQPTTLIHTAHYGTTAPTHAEHITTLLEERQAQQEIDMEKPIEEEKVVTQTEEVSMAEMKKLEQQRFAEEAAIFQETFVATVKEDWDHQKQEELEEAITAEWSTAPWTKDPVD